MIVAASNCLTAIQARWIGAIRVVRQKRTGKAVHGRCARFGGERRFTWGARYMQRKRGHPAGRDTLNPDSSARQPGKAQGRQRPWGALKRAYSSWNKWSNSKLPCGLRGSQCCLETTEDT